jgi:hypothetical protein
MENSYATARATSDRVKKRSWGRFYEKTEYSRLWNTRIGADDLRRATARGACMIDDEFDMLFGVIERMAERSSETKYCDKVAKMHKNQLDAYLRVGFTKSQSFNLVRSGLIQMNRR